MVTSHVTWKKGGCNWILKFPIKLQILLSKLQIVTIPTVFIIGLIFLILTNLCSYVILLILNFVIKGVTFHYVIIFIYLLISYSVIIMTNMLSVVQLSLACPSSLDLLS